MKFVEIIEKFNPNHDGQGRFSNAAGATLMAFGNSPAGQKTMQNYQGKNKTGAVGGGADKDDDPISASPKDRINQLTKDNADEFHVADKTRIASVYRMKQENPYKPRYNKDFYAVQMRENHKQLPTKTANTIDGAKKLLSNFFGTDEKPQKSTSGPGTDSKGIRDILANEFYNGASLKQAVDFITRTYGETPSQKAIDRVKQQIKGTTNKDWN